MNDYRFPASMSCGHNPVFYGRPIRVGSGRLFAKPGQRVVPPPDTIGYISTINAAAHSYTEVEEALNWARHRLELVLM